MQSIQSVHNPLVQAAKALQSKAGRQESGLLLCEGEHMVAEAAAVCPQAIVAVLVAQERADDFPGILSRLPGAVQYSVPAHVLASLSQVKTPQGIAAMVRQPTDVPLAALGKRIVLLENVQDPGNVGTILRTADAAGFTGCLLTPGCADPFSPKALRATMGSVFRVPLGWATDAQAAAQALAANGYAVLAASLSGEDFYAREALPATLCLMIGNEGAGLTPQANAAATHRYRLPMRGGAESLNAAIAAAVFMFDLTYRTPPAP